MPTEPKTLATTNGFSTIPEDLIPTISMTLGHREFGIFASSCSTVRNSLKFELRVRKALATLDESQRATLDDIIKNSELSTQTIHKLLAYFPIGYVCQMLAYNHLNKGNICTLFKVENLKYIDMLYKYAGDFNEIGRAHV